MFNYPLKQIHWVAILSSLINCIDEAKHENPLDPHHNKNGFTLTGNVSTLYAPIKAIPNAIISLHPGDTKTFTNSDGNFEIIAAEGFYTIKSSIDGYSSDSSIVEINKNIEINFNLDGLPFFESLSLTTHHTSRFFPIDDMYHFTIEARVNDLDGISDINKVYFDLPDFNTSDTLNAGLETGFFSKIFSVEDLPINTIHNLIGREFILYVEDDVDRKSVV